MKKTTLLFAFLLSILSKTTVLAEEKISFINDNLTAAINQASHQGKLIFLDFYANYCSPCKLMEQYTFTDPSVIERMNKAYVPVRVNIENFDGYDLKNQFQVKVLPTLIVLNSKGQLVGRYEESMTGSRLTSVLAKHDVDINRRVIAPMHNSGTGYTGFSSTNTATTVTTNSSTITTKPTGTPSSSANKPFNTTPSVSNNRPSANNNVPNNYNNAPSNPTKLKPLPANENPLLETRKLKQSTYTIQVGSFTNEKNAKTLGETLTRKLGSSQRVFMLKAKSAQGATYRVFVGHFSSRQQATDFRLQKEFEGFIQDYANFNH